MPEIFCSISIHTHTADNAQIICKQLGTLGVNVLEEKISKEHDLVRIVIAREDYSANWYLDEVLASLLSQIKVSLSQVREIAHLHNAGIQIDIALWQYGTFPSLSIAGDNMRKIRELEADIDIDAYSGKS